MAAVDDDALERGAAEEDIGFDLLERAGQMDFLQARAVLEGSAFDDFQSVAEADVLQFVHALEHVALEVFLPGAEIQGFQVGAALEDRLVDVQFAAIEVDVLQAGAVLEDFCAHGEFRACYANLLQRRALRKRSVAQTHGVFSTPVDAWQLRTLCEGFLSDALHERPECYFIQILGIFEDSLADVLCIVIKCDNLEITFTEETLIAERGDDIPLAIVIQVEFETQSG